MLNLVMCVFNSPYFLKTSTRQFFLAIFIVGLVVSRSTSLDLNDLDDESLIGLGKQPIEYSSNRSGKLRYQADDVSYFLDSHKAHRVHDPRVYFTDERSTRSMAIMLKETERLPSSVRFAYLIRVMNELGRKIVSKLNYYSLQVAATLKKRTDKVGATRITVGVLADTVTRAFDSKVDEYSGDELNDEENLETPITSAIGNDTRKQNTFEASLETISERFLAIVVYFTRESLKTIEEIVPKRKLHRVVDILTDAIKVGSKSFVDELSGSDKFRIAKEVEEFANKILDKVCDSFGENLESTDSINIPSEFKKVFGDSFRDLNPLSDSIALSGTWNSYLLTNLGNAERVIKVFASLLKRVPVNVKSRWINLYQSQAIAEIEKTLPGFVAIHSLPFKQLSSELLALEPDQVAAITDSNDSSYSTEKGRIPARCYLAGRRWRMILRRSMMQYPLAELVVTSLADKLGQIKLGILKQNGNEPLRLCIPRLEVGLRGWNIDGNPQVRDQFSANFPLKSPLQDLDHITDPFGGGAILGYNIGFRVGYNEERNATLELENAGATRKVRGQSRMDAKSRLEVEYLARASYRQAATEAAKRVFGLAIREGYLTTLRISVESGIRIPAEAGSRIAALRCAQLAGQIGRETGELVAEGYLSNRELSETTRRKLVDVGGSYGLASGQTMGRRVGAIVGKAAAEEAYRRIIMRAGKLIEVRFHLEEYEVGAKLAFELGVGEGKRVATSSLLDPSAPRFLPLNVPILNELDKRDVRVDHWEKDLIPPLTGDQMNKLHAERRHIMVSGSLRGLYKLSRETREGLKRISYVHENMELEVFAEGFTTRDNVTYLKLNGTVDGFGALHGSLVVRDLFEDSGEDIGEKEADGRQKSE